MKLRIITLAGLLGLACLSSPGQVINLTKTAAGLNQGTGTTAVVMHDLNNMGCRTCHAPHNGSSGTSNTPDMTGAYLLWSQAFPTVTAYGTYASNQMAILTVTASEVAGSLPQQPNLTTPDVRVYTLLCLSCHDGVTAQNSTNGLASIISGLNAGKGMNLRNSIAMTGSTNSLGLQNDHPVNVVYSTSKDTHLFPAVATFNTVGGMPLYGPSTALTVQCATCHDPHNDATNGFFLRVPNTSDSCVACHGN